MAVIKVEFFASTKYVSSMVSEEIEIEIDDEDIDDEKFVDSLIDEVFEEWLAGAVSAGWEKLDE